jgi:hypothetical protein
MWNKYDLHHIGEIAFKTEAPTEPGNPTTFSIKQEAPTELKPTK